MTIEEKVELVEIATGKGWEARTRLQEYLKTVRVVSVEEDPKDPATSPTAPSRRTGDQNSALHLWFRQIAEVCRDSGLDAQLLFSKTVDLEVNDEAIKTIWKAIQRAYYKTESTTQLTKTKQMDTIIDTMVRFFGERHHIELPPFPNDESKNNMRLNAMDNLKNEDYPEYIAPTL